MKPIQLLKMTKKTGKRQCSAMKDAMVDAGGFKLRKVQVDAGNMSAYQRLGGDDNGTNLDSLPKDKTMRDEDNDAEYVIDGPLRRLTPYYFTYMTYCKERWRDRKLLDVFTNEFRLYPETYYINALNSGRVTLNNKPADVDSVIRNGDLICHRIHRHEPAVSSRPIKIVHQDDDYVIIDKPSGIPVHPTGRYRHNTITFILEKQLGFKVHPCNRLDRLTSGLMLLAKTGKGAEAMFKQLKEREIHKEYIAKVVGEFPLDEMTVEKPLLTLDPRLSFNIIDGEKGKAAKTVFKRLSYDGQTSLVLCKPLTGRTHQIRVHLQYLGYPIVNDPLYSSPKIWGEKLGKDGVFELEPVMEKLRKIGKTEYSSSWLYPDSEGEVKTNEVCEICQGELYSDPGVNDLDLCLHAFKYESNDKKWSYRTELPEWALEQQIKMMELALDEAKKCTPIDSAFCVGCVITHEGKVISTGYTRELEGNTHAEQNALTKYFRENDELPRGCELYTTMEPCSERLSGNKPCLNRILDLKDHFTTVYVGVMEPTDFIANNVSYDKLTSAGALYFKVPGFQEKAMAVAKKGHQ